MWLNKHRVSACLCSVLVKSILNWRVIGLRQGDGDDDGDDDSLYNRCLHGLPALFADKDNMRVTDPW